MKPLFLPLRFNHLAQNNPPRPLQYACRPSGKPANSARRFRLAALAFLVSLFSIHAAATVPAVVNTSAYGSYPQGEPLLDSASLADFEATAHESVLEEEDGLSREDFFLVRSGEQDTPYGPATIVEVLRSTSFSYRLELRANIPRAVRSGDVGFVRFFVRDLTPPDIRAAENNDIYFAVYEQDPESDFKKSFYDFFKPATAWKEYIVPFEFNGGGEAGQRELVFGIGGPRKTLEFAGLELHYYGDGISLGALPQMPLSYDGIEPDAPWRAEAQQRIAEHRMEDYAVKVVDREGNPMPGLKVAVRMQRHAFPFSTAVKARLINDSGHNAQIYKARLLEYFNAASSENFLKWGGWNEEWGNPDGTMYSQDDALQALRWLDDNHFEIRGHVLVWPGWKNLPKGVKEARENNPDAIPQIVLDHIDEITQATKDYVGEWDVLNEPFDNHDLMDLFGDQVMVDWFKQARKNLPDARLYLNDWGIISGGNEEHRQHFEDTIQFLLDNGAPITGIGVQGHFGGEAEPRSPLEIYNIIDRYAKFGLDIKVTEYDHTTRNEYGQARYLRDVLTIVFSHPRIAGFQFWGFWAGAHWRPVGALFDHDWRVKPIAEAYRKLVYEDWWTSEELSSGEDGTVAGRGFLGDYTASVRLDEAWAEDNGYRKLSRVRFTLEKPAEGESAPVVVLKLLDKHN